MSRRAVIVDVVRSPFTKGREGGALSPLHPVDLYAGVLEALLRRSGLDATRIEDVITGCVAQVGEQAANIARHAILAAGFPETVPGVTLDRKCGSAQQAVDFAAQGVIAGAYDVAVAGGVEMMSRVNMRVNRMGRDEHGPRLRERYPDGLVRQGISAELIAARWDISREEMDTYSLESHRRAARAEDAGITARDIIAIEVPDTSGGTVTVAHDEGIRRDTSAERLAALRPAFEDARMAERFPQLRWSVTAGNSSQISDGAAAVLVMEQTVAERLGLEPRAAVTHFSVIGDDPLYMLTGPIPATERLLERAGLSVEDIDRFEVNEAFASVVLAWQKSLGVESERVNVHGGAISLGHPVGASGGRLLANLLGALEISKGRYGVQVMCESGGMANATLIERLR